MIPEVYDKAGNILQNDDVVKIECTYDNERNGEIHKLTISYYGCRDNGTTFGKGNHTDYYSILLDEDSWDGFQIDNYKKQYTCKSLLKQVK